MIDSGGSTWWNDRTEDNTVVTIPISFGSYWDSERQIAPLDDKIETKEAYLRMCVILTNLLSRQISFSFSKIYVHFNYVY
jgi:hypothetical protein